MKKRIALILTAVLGASCMLTGCGGGSGNKESAETAKKEDKGTETISLLSWYNEDILGEFIDGFEKENPGIEVDLQYVPPTQQYVDKFSVLASSGQMTDMFFTAAENNQEVRDKGLAEDISDLPIFERIDEKVSSTYSDGDKIYAYAPDAWVGGIFYNKALFEQAGISGEPKTWDDMVDAMTKLKDAGIEPYLDSQENVYNLPLNLYFDMVISKDREADAKINKGEAKFADFYTEPMDLWYKDMVETGLYSQISLGLSSDQVLDMFVTGQVAMMHGGPWNVQTIESKNPDMEYDIFPLPDNDGNVVFSGAVNVGMSISSSTEKKESCKKFLEYMSEDENILKWQKCTGNAIVVQGIEYEMNSVFDKFKQEAVDGNFYWPPCVWNNSAGILKELVAASQDAVTGADTAENVAARLDTKMEELSE